MFAQTPKPQSWSCHNLFSFDYPDIAGKFEFEAEFGDFGEARKELADATGKDKMNVFIKSSMFSFKVLVDQLLTIVSVTFLILNPITFCK